MSLQAAGDGEQHNVRFSSHNDEIQPATNFDPADDNDRHDLNNPQAREELRELKNTLQNTVQSKRMELHSFEPVSLPGSQPVSRVPSGTTTPSRRLPAGSAAPSPRHSPPHSRINSPPLTPAATGSREHKPSTSGATFAQAQRQRRTPDVMTPQRSQSPPTDDKIPPVSLSEAAGGAVASHPKATPKHSLGPQDDSIPGSENVSPGTTPGNVTPGNVTPGNVTPGTMTPSSPGHSSIASQGDGGAAHKRSIPGNDAESIEARFRFGNRDPRRGHSTSGTSINIPKEPFSSTNIPGSLTPRGSQSGSSTNLKSQHDDNKRHSIFGMKRHDSDDGNGKVHHKEASSSKSNLKRFFKFGGDHKHKEKKSHSPTRAREDSVTPPNGAVPFADDHGLQTKYGKFGKMLGSGAGGSVRLMRRTGDGKTFAVKQFRTKHSYESEREYNKKVTAEFCIGSTLHHGNIIETIDIVHEKGSWYEVMEYAPFDLFATVMTGKMSREEVTCCTLQILSGVTYLHTMGLAHRDLKLDNVVINDSGIMKIIDFGSAVVFRYPFENDIALATGVVGSDPYLAPEVYDNAKYDPQCADVWSIAIIYCCMILRRFPWKAPRLSDSSYRLFVSTPDPGQAAMLEQSRRSSQNPSRAPSASEASGENGNGQHHHHNETSAPAPSSSGNIDAQSIKGPIRLLRLLPRESRHIMSRMLELDPRKRATVDEILEDPWVQNAFVCRQEEGGQCFQAPGHIHNLEGSGVSTSTKK